ncbi:AurF N-oxygenase family protein [Nocardia sp. CA-290969]|uniref:AurF N-oxygenase family protein n=1 Tax=Nocardia sp. CA-290969 TaxID=3239986 RepID=UPI003D90DF87
MTPSTLPRAPKLDARYREMLETLSEGSVRRRFDPYLDIDWDAPELALDRDDPRWILSPDYDPLGATSWYRQLPAEKQIEIGRWRIANAIKVGAAFETVLIRGMMQYIAKLPNGSPEFRYCLHEMTEECNHIQMFQELVNRIGDDVPGMRPIFRALSPFIGVAGGYAHVVLFLGILGGEEPIDHYQKAMIRNGANLPPLVVRAMEIHIAEEARHISFAGEFLRAHIAKLGPIPTALCGVSFPLALRWLAGEIMAPPPEFARRFDIPREVIKEAFWRSPHARGILAGYFGDMRTLADELGLMNPVTKRLWRALGIDGDRARYRSEPERRIRPAVA